MTSAEPAINPLSPRTRRWSDDPVVEGAEPGRPTGPVDLLLPAQQAGEDLAEGTGLVDWTAARTRGRASDGDYQGTVRAVDASKRTFDEEDSRDRPARRTAAPRREVRFRRFRRIVAPIDFSHASEGALAEAMAQAMPGESKIWLLHVVEPDPGLAGMEAVILSKPDAVLVAEAVARLERFAAPPRDLGYTVDVIVRLGRRDEVICRVACELHADLIVLGQHKHIRWERWLTRTTAERTLWKAPCAVLVLPPIGSPYDGVGGSESVTVPAPDSARASIETQGAAAEERAQAKDF